MSKETELKGLKLRLTFMSNGAYRNLIDFKNKATTFEQESARYWQGYNDCLGKIIKMIDEEIKNE